MQRFLRFPATRPGLMRRIIQPSATREATQQVIIRHVKVTKKFPWKRIALFTITGIVCLQIYSSKVTRPLSEAIEKASKQLPPKPKKDELGPTFIPFPFTTRKIDPEPYAGTDPEWMEFVRMAKDKELQRVIRDDLADVVRTQAERVKWLKVRFGNDLKIRRYWLDVDYPSTPAPTFEISGLKIDEEEITWTAAPIESALVFKTNKTLWPKTAFLASGAFVGALVKQNVDSVRRYFGIPESSPGTPANPGDQPLPPPHSPDIQKTLQKLRQHTTQKPEEVKDPRTLAKNAASEPDPTAPEKQHPPEHPQQKQQQGTSETPMKAASVGQGSKDESGDAASKQKFILQDDIRAMIGQKPWDAFKARVAQSLRPNRTYPPRGCVLVSGFVELEGKRGWVVIDVLAWYNPKTKKYDPRSMILKMRRMQTKVQHPKR